jgi:muconolactone delta-isomerase
VGRDEEIRYLQAALAAAEAGMQAVLASLPLDAWLTEQTTPLSPHPGDPALASS